MSTGIPIGTCRHCKTEAFMTRLNEVTWGTSYSSCEGHELNSNGITNSNSNSNSNSYRHGEEDMRKVSSPISSKSMSFSSEFGAREGNFPTEKEATYRMCLFHVKGKCGAYVTKYEEDLAKVEDEARRNEEEIEKQFSITIEKAEQRKKDLLEKLQTKKIERETVLSDSRDKLIHYEEKCSKGIQEIWQTIQGQEENLAREQQCEKIARTIALEIPILYSIPYSLKFDPKEMTRINSMVSSCGQIQFTELDRKKKIEEFCWRDVDRQWLQPSSAPASASTSTLATPKSKIITERPETAKKEHYGNYHSAEERKHDELDPGQSSYEGMDNETDSVIKVRVKYMENIESITIPKQEWGLSNLQKRVVETFSMSNPPETLTFNVTDGTKEKKFDLNKYDPNTQFILVVSGEASTKPSKIGREKKIKLFITNNGKRTKFDLTNPDITFTELKENVKNKSKEQTDNFTIQIGSGINKGKSITSDDDIGLLFCGDSQVEITVVH